MNLDKNYRLLSDEHNFILQRKVPLRTKKRAGKTKEWKNVGYWRDLGQALASYARRSIRDDMPSSLKELLALERGQQMPVSREQLFPFLGRDLT